MKTLLALLLTTVSFLANAEGFNFSAYRPASITDISAQWNGITKGYQPGFSVKSPEKIAVTVIAVSAPFKCANDPLAAIFNSLTMPDYLKQVPISHCIKLKRDEASPEFFAYVQDALVPSYMAEVKPNSSVKLFVGFLAYAVTKDPANNFPLFAVNEFQAL